ncbi:extracellular solute-binding protein [Corynebacterium uterequi]|uniref:ABC-type Fe3+ transport system, periplasmic component n=1 Tax=Corynebacterium uterequi TaxID=1072256 RepID=A0A0G3HES8_9CORY|nr:extracellular solute-binding protein [Corynebacterium uterequi]AKK11225.1 ABC-type Fe3+ transport system, periplasmic component [Corynebacterium uterequi]
MKNGANFFTRAAVLVSTSLFLVSCGNTGALDSAAGGAGSEAAGDNIVITYNTPEKWGNYGKVLDAFEAETGIAAPNDPKNSGQTLAALQAEKSSPVADVAYVGIAFAEQLENAGVLQPYKPAGTEEVDPNLKDPDGNWTTVHAGTVAFIVNEDHLDGAPVPKSWADLLKPEYAGKVGFLDPTQAAVGYSVATAANIAMGGDLDNWDPGFEYLKKLKDNGAIISAQTATAKVAQGEIPILIDADFNGYQLKDEGANVTLVIPEEGSLRIPYVVGLVNGAPHEENGKKLLDFYFTEEGQALFAEGFMGPAVGSIPDQVKDSFLPDADYERAVTIDYLKQGEVQQDFNARYRKEMS